MGKTGRARTKQVGSGLSKFDAKIQQIFGICKFLDAEKYKKWQKRDRLDPKRNRLAETAARARQEGKDGKGERGREKTASLKEKRPQAAPAQREKRIRELGKGRGKVKSERTKKGEQKETFSNEKQKKRNILMIKRNKK